MALVLWSCVGERACDTAECDDSSPFTGASRLDDFGWGCESSTWWYDVYTIGLTGSATVDAHDGTVTERHPLAERASDPYGYWDQWYSEIAVVDGEYEPGVSTRFGCEDENNLTFKVTVTDTDGGTLPCRAYGAEPAVFPECEAAK
jgi:hypothetical protein